MITLKGAGSSRGGAKKRTPKKPEETENDETKVEVKGEGGGGEGEGGGARDDLQFQL